MIIKTKEFQDSSRKILEAIDTEVNSQLNATVELSVSNNSLQMSVTNKEYFVTITMDVESNEDFRAVVDAKKFLTLVSKITTETVELDVIDSKLKVKANGNYTFPMIYGDKDLLVLPRIEIQNPTVNFNIESSVLTSIAKVNSSEVVYAIKEKMKPVRQMYYIDEQGCVTVSGSACVNSFTLAEPVKMLLNHKLVSLFKLFSNGEVSFTLGYDAIRADLIQTKVNFRNDNVSISAIISSDSALMNSMPATAIRSKVSGNYSNSVVVNTHSLIEALDRLLLFKDEKAKSKDYGRLSFDDNELVVNLVTDDNDKNNKEYVKYENQVYNCNYTTLINLERLRRVLCSYTEPMLTLFINDSSQVGRAIILSNGSVKSVVPEAQE